jgi:hypothetical protein
MRWGWGCAALVIGLACWLVGDGHAVGINAPIPEGAKLAITLLGWPYMIDGVRVLIGHRPFMRKFTVYALYALAAVVLIGLAAWLAMSIYDALSLKAMVAVGLAVALVLLFFILRELRRMRN